MQIKYDENVIRILKAAGLTDKQIREQEIKDTQHANRILKKDQLIEEPTERTEDKYNSGDLKPMGYSQG